MELGGGCDVPRGCRDGVPRIGRWRARVRVGGRGLTVFGVAGPASARAAGGGSGAVMRAAVACGDGALDCGVSELVCETAVCPGGVG
eukprot:7278377-Prymnesium_polylepis.1